MEPKYEIGEKVRVRLSQKTIEELKTHNGADDEYIRHNNKVGRIVFVDADELEYEQNDQDSGEYFPYQVTFDDHRKLDYATSELYSVGCPHRKRT
jgi:deoxyinosine 3'endonuclease (endonuclease V)